MEFTIKKKETDPFLWLPVLVIIYRVSLLMLDPFAMSSWQMIVQVRRCQGYQNKSICLDVNAHGCKAASFIRRLTCSVCSAQAPSTDVISLPIPSKFQRRLSIFKQNKEQFVLHRGPFYLMGNSHTHTSLCHGVEGWPI